MNEKDKKIWSEAAEATASLGDSWDAQVAFLQKFADLVRADEREACANICETLELPDWPDKVRQPLAQAIRARGQE
jgi:hypothetical protein